MKAEEEQQLRAAIRQAFEVQNWEGDVGFLLGEEAPLRENESSDLPPFLVWVSSDGIANVSVPPSWENEPYIREVLCGMAQQELHAHLGLPQD